MRSELIPSIVLGMIFLVFSLSSCDYDMTGSLNEHVQSFNAFDQKDSLHFEEIYEYVEGVPESFHVQDSALVILNSRAKNGYYFHNYILKNGTLSEGYLKRGKGPGEALGIISSGIKDNILWSYDITKNTVLTLGLDTAIFLGECNKFNSFKLAEQGWNRMSCIGSNEFAGTSCAKFKVSLLDIKSGKRNEDVGEFAFIPSDVPLGAFKDAYTSLIFAKSSSDKIVLAYRYTDVVEIINLKNDSVRTLHGPDCFDVKYDIGSSNTVTYMAKTEETRKAFVNGCVTDRFVYLLYSGHHRTHAKWSYGKKVFVYDWNGNPVKSFDLDRYVYAIGVSNDDKLVYSYDIQEGNLLKGNIDV